MSYPTTRRHPRTLQEAFGPHTSLRIDDPGKPLRLSLWGALVDALRRMLARWTTNNTRSTLR